MEQYPHVYDNLSAVNPDDPIEADHENLQTNAIHAIEATLGLEPQGSYSTVAEALAGKLDKSGGSMSGDLSLGGHKVSGVGQAVDATDAANAGVVQRGELTYAQDTGLANAYAIALTPAVPAYTAGMRLAFLAGHANSGASTLDVDGLGAKSVSKQGGVPLEPGDIVLGQTVEVVYDGTSFQMVGLAQVSPNYGGQSSISTVDTVTSGTWQATPIDIAHGGTGQAGKTAGFDALSPTTARGDLISHDGTGNFQLWEEVALRATAARSAPTASSAACRLAAGSSSAAEMSSTVTATASSTSAPTRVSTRHTYDLDKRLVQVSDGRGRALFLDYGDRTDGQPVSVRAQDAAIGRQAVLDYYAPTDPAPGRLKSVTEPTGDVTKFGYDAQGLLAQIIDPRGNTSATFTYEASEPMIQLAASCRWSTLLLQASLPGMCCALRSSRRSKWIEW